MKLRIQGDSLRLRLTRSEVRQFAETGAVESAMQVAPGVRLTYGLRASDRAGLAVAMNEHRVTVWVPHGWIADWADGDAVGFSGEQDAGEGRTLSILVEKDFECLHKRPDEQDAFPHPRADAR